MANQPSNLDEKQFMESTGFDTLGNVKPLPPQKRDRIAARARLTAGLASNAEPAAESLVHLAARRPASRGLAPHWRWVMTAAMTVAAVFAFVLAPGMNSSDVAMAMEKAIANLTSYHGVVAVQTLDEKGYTDAKPDRSEIWEAGDKYRWIAHSYDSKGEIVSDTWFVSDGDRSWGLNTRSKEVSVGLALDSVRLRENLGVKALARWTLRNPHKVVGEETVAGRKATKLEVSSPSGMTDLVWIDAETHLPLKAIQWQGRGMQKVITYAQLEVNTKIDPTMFAVQVPSGYKLNEQPGQWVSTFAEAARIAGFQPLVPKVQPKRIAAWKGNVALVYDGAVAYQKTDLLPIWTHGSWIDGLAQTGSGLLAISNDGEDWRWHQNGLDVVLNGPDPEQLEQIARSIVPDLIVPDPKQDVVSQAKVKVEVDMAQAQEIQKQADQRGAPEVERQSPANAAYTFLTTMYGKLPFKHDLYNGSDLTVSAHTGVEAVVEVPSGQVQKVYVKRLISPTTQGAWFVVGYDLR